MKDRSQSKIEEIRKKHFRRGYRGILDDVYYYDHPYMLQPILHWSFNLFTLERLTAGFPLFAVGNLLFEKSKFFQKFNIEYFDFARLLRRIEDLYHENNYYHNALHAADVAQAIYCLLKRLRVEKYISSFDFMCAILAAICHDIDHPGVNPSFLVKTKQLLSVFYQESILEHHHANVAISVLLQSDVFRRFSQRRWNMMKSIVCHLILATDISKQQDYINKFDMLTERRYSTSNYQPSGDDITLVMELAIKCADISNPCRQWETCFEWANCITEEFFQQGDRESLLGLQVLPIMDRERTTKARVQIGFIQFQVLPLFQRWDAYIRSKFSRSLVDKCKKNLALWKAKDAAESRLQAIRFPS